MKKDDHVAHSQNEVGMKTVMERLPLLLMEEMLGDRSSMVSCEGEDNRGKLHCSLRGYRRESEESFGQ
jgi:hypothetical protein